MAISPETEEKLRMAWEASIPTQYRFKGDDAREWKNGGGVSLQPAAIVALPEKNISRNDRFFDKLDATRHLTAQQLSEGKRREAIAAKAAAKKAANVEGNQLGEPSYVVSCSGGDGPL